MAITSIFPVEELRKLISYDPKTGSLYWRARDIDSFPCERTGKSWNARWAGSKAINAPHCLGYLAGAIRYKKFLAHRVAWAMHYGYWPENQIDHINGIKTDNRICNLREATACENMRNAGQKARNTSGYKGVTWDKSKSKWQAAIRYEGKSKFLGRFDDPEAAYAAYCSAAHKYHGEFARTE